MEVVQHDAHSLESNTRNWKCIDVRLDKWLCEDCAYQQERGML